MKTEPDIKTIIYATDLGEQTRPVFRHAVAMASHYGAEIVMVHVVEPMSESAKAIVSSYLAKELTEEAQKEAMQEILGVMKNRLKKFCEEENRGDTASPPVREVMVVMGKPSEEILRIAEEEQGDLIVMGKSTRKVRGIRVMGSTARRVSRMSDIPVLVVPNY